MYDLEYGNFTNRSFVKMFIVASNKIKLGIFISSFESIQMISVELDAVQGVS